LPWLVKDKATLCTCRKECNKYDLIATQCFWLAHHNDSSKWFAISSAPRICCPNFSLMGEVIKEYRTKLGCERYFRKVTCWAQLEMLLVNVIIMGKSRENIRILYIVVPFGNVSVALCSSCGN
jgi:hypothetical protein